MLRTADVRAGFVIAGFTTEARHSTVTERERYSSLVRSLTSELSSSLYFERDVIRYPRPDEIEEAGRLGDEVHGPEIEPLGLVFLVPIAVMKRRRCCS